jgi:APA family basic amino acid/polyamine antiporter
VAQSPASDEATRRLGLVPLTALVVGNMVGSGVFLLPAALAPFGGVSLLGWLASAGGATLLGLAIARSARRLPEPGGPYAYTRGAFGDFAAFLVGWGYWISCWCAQAAIAIAMVGYLGSLVPFVTASSFSSSATAIAAIALLCAINVAGVRGAGRVQTVTVVLKVLPLLAVALFGLAHLEPAHFRPFNPTGMPLLIGVQACLGVTLWAFQGFESASIAARDARDPHRNVPRATLLGIGLATLLYVGATTAVMGLMPLPVLGSSTAPFADAAAALWGPVGHTLIALGAIVSCFGALNGWILVAGRMPWAIARDGLFPRVFDRLSRRGTPTVGLVVSSSLACALVIANHTDSLVTMFTGMIVLSTMSALVPLLFGAMAEVHASLRERVAGRPGARLGIVIGLAAFAYGLLTIHGMGDLYVARGFLLLLAGIPFYALARSRR